MTGLIYTFTNKENGKEYVGQTIQPIEVRDYAHYYEAFNQNKGGKFNNALRKYGKGGFIRSIVHEITPTGESAQVMEFNVSLPCGANASIAPVSTLTVTQRWAKVVNVSTTGTEYVQVTKFDVIHNIQYTDCKGNVRVSTESTSTIMETAATSETITTLTPTVTKVIDVIIPNGVSIVSQQVLDELPTSLPVKGHCAYSVFDVRVTPAPAPTAAIASVAKSK